MTSAQPTISQLLHRARRRLSQAGVDSSGLDAELLVRHVTGLTREGLYMRLGEPADPGAEHQLADLLTSRLDGVPIAYITGQREFYGRDFVVSPAVLVPRPETEFLVEWALRRLSQSPAGRRVVDVGTGSGAIAISIARETDNRHHVVATDVSLEALEIARTNRDRHQAGVELVAGSLLDWWRGPVDLIVANLPYLRPDQAHEGIRFEPSVALYSGGDGFALNRTLIEQAVEVLAAPGAMILEIDPGQASLARETAARVFPDSEARIERDLAGIERYLTLERAQAIGPA